MFKANHSVTRKPLFWILFSSAFIACILFTFKYFSKAMPIINIDIKIDREDALKKSKELAEKFGWGPSNHKQAAAFEVDQYTKIFVELECGGQKELIKIMEQNLYMPYQWKVRHFKESEENQTFISFTPEGKPYGFIQYLSEDTPGADLPADKAREIAEKWSTEQWKIKLDEFKLVESSKEIQPSKRGDHTFVYERPDKTVGEEGLFRLKIVISGEKVSEINHFIKIPEDFHNRYKEMRSANNSIAHGASFLFILLYIFFGCLIGLFFLYKERYVIWKAPALLGVIFALLNFANNINQIPLQWMLYDTAMPQNRFLTQILLQSFTSFLFSFFFYTFIFIAAESLTRKAFGNHIQLWKIWSKKNAASISILGRTIGGYLLVGFDLAYLVLVYLLSTKFLGWWVPSDQLANPNILAHYLPWLSSFYNSLSAGFWEECIFRAVPLSCAALIGKKFGKKNIWIAGAFILQAIIFGAAHANYITQPSYARIIELIMPSFAFAAIYLTFGLLTAILTHFILDVSLMSIPLFVSSAPDAWANQLIIIVVASIPLIVVLISRIRIGKWTELTKDSLNKSWRPPEKITMPKEQEPIIQKKVALKTTTIVPFLIGGIIGTSLWLYFTPFTHNSKRMNITQKEAIVIAKKALKKNEIAIPKSWTALSTLSPSIAELQQKFIWQKNKALYKNLLGTHLREPEWLVRFVSFVGTIQQRAEEYQVFVNKNGDTLRISHKIPESNKGANLSEAEAREIAHIQLVQKFNLDPKKIKKVSAVSEKLKNRLRWMFTFSNKAVYPLEKGDARINIAIDGNEVVSTLEYIHTPEEWTRTERNKQALINILKMICSLLLMALIALTLIFAGKGLTRFSTKWAITTFGMFFTIKTILIINKFLQLISMFNPIEPFYNQLFVTVGSLILSTLITSGLIAIIVGMAMSYKTKIVMAKKTKTLIAFFSFAMLLVGTKTFIEYLKPSLTPLLPNFAPIVSYFPAITMLLDYIIIFFLFTSSGILVLSALNYLTNERKYITYILPLIFIIANIAILGVYEIESISFWLISGIATGVVSWLAYILFIKYDHSIIPILIATAILTDSIQKIVFNAYPSALVGGILSSVIIIILAILWSMRLNK